MGEMTRGRLRWKRHERETGLRAVGARPRGWDLHDGIDKYAAIYPNGGGWQCEQNGWYWASFGLVPRVNTCHEPVQTPEEAKAAAMAYVKSHLAKATTP